MPIQAAEKTKKAAFIESFNDDMGRGFIKVSEDAPVLSEWDILQWHEMGLREDPRYLNDCSDATLYMYRLSRHFMMSHVEVKPKFGEPGYYELLEKEIEDRVRIRTEGKSRQGPWWSRNIRLN